MAEFRKLDRRPLLAASSEATDTVQGHIQRMHRILGPIPAKLISKTYYASYRGLSAPSSTRQIEVIPNMAPYLKS